MKPLYIFTASLAFILSGTARHAYAGSSERAFVAGAIGGAVVTHAFNRPRFGVGYSHCRPVHVPVTCAPTYVVRRPTYVRTSYGSSSRGTYVTSARSNSYLNETVVESGGYYKVVRERVWIPAYREKVQTAGGAWIVRYIPGRYDFQTRRVWVPKSGRSRVVYVR